MRTTLIVAAIAFLTLISTSGASAAPLDGGFMPILGVSDMGYAGAGIGAGLVVLGLGVGIGRIGGSACEALARQPEVSNKIQTMMLLAAALIEGAGFFALVITLLVVLLK